MKMKKNKIKLTITILGAILTTLLMVSTATAVQITNENSIQTSDKTNIEKNVENIDTKIVLTEKILEEKIGLDLDLLLEKINNSDKTTLMAGLGIATIVGLLCSAFSLTAGYLWSWPIFGIIGVSLVQTGRAFSNQEPLTTWETILCFILYANPIGAFLDGFTITLSSMNPPF